MKAAAHNQLLDRLRSDDRAQLLATEEPVTLHEGTLVIAAGRRLTHAYFPIDCAVTVLAPNDGLPKLEIGLVGREGMVGMPMILGADSSRICASVQSGGRAWRIDAARFAWCLETSAGFRECMNRYVHVHWLQLAESAGCRSFHLVPARVARWLLMSRDRTQSSEIELTHESLALTLGVRRAGITLAASALRERRLIDYSRGHIVVLDAKGLESAACPCYASAKKTYARFMR
jgi:CRP-like cAMP-binding protein